MVSYLCPLDGFPGVATTAIAMLAGRFGLILPALALAGVLSTTHRRDPSEGSIPTDGPLYGVVILGTCIIVGALSYLPALALGPLAEHFFMMSP